MNVSRSAFVSVILLSILSAVMISQVFSAVTDGSNPFDMIWEAIQDLQSQIDTIELTPGPPGPTGPQGLPGEQGPPGPPGGFDAPNFDSGWMTISPASAVNLNHSLGTRSLFVYLVGKNVIDSLLGIYHIHQDFYGFSEDNDSIFGARWTLLDDNRIQIVRGAQDNWWHEFRVYIWVLP